MLFLTRSIPIIDEKFKREEGSEPVRPVSRKFKICIVDMLPKDDGIALFRLFIRRFSSQRLGKKPNSSGMPPLNWLASRDKS